MASTAEVRTLPAAEIEALKKAIEMMGTQVAVAKVLGVSSSTVSQALKSHYVGDVDALGQRIRGALMNELVSCPVMGALSAKHCLDYQTRPLVFTNPLRVRLYRACKTCPNRQGGTR